MNPSEQRDTNPSSNRAKYLGSRNHFTSADCTQGKKISSESIEPRPGSAMGNPNTQGILNVHYNVSGRFHKPASHKQVL